jgi:site-specific recombinase XerD
MAFQAKSLLLQAICRAKLPCKDLGGLGVRIFRRPLRSKFTTSHRQIDMTGSFTEIGDQECLAQFERYLFASDLASVTVSNYLSDLQAFARWLRQRVGGQASLLRCNPADVQDYCTFLRETQHLSAATINRCLQAIRKFAKFALAAGLAETDPTSGLKRLREERTSWGRMLSPDEVTRLVEAIQNGRRSLIKRDLAVVLLVLHAGLKVGELVSLRAADFESSEEGETITVRRHDGERGRTVPLPPEVSSALQEYLRIRLAPPTIEHLFLSQQGTPISARSVQRLIREYAAAAGLGEVSASTLRRTYAQTVWEKTGNLSQVASALGHTRLNSTIRYMASILEDRSGIKEKSSANVSQRR